MKQHISFPRSPVKFEGHTSQKKTGQIWGFRTFPGECVGRMTWNLHADVSWPLSELIKFWSRSVHFLNFWQTFDLVKRVKLGVSMHYLENTGEEWPKIWHADVSWPLSKWLHFGHGLPIFPILVMSASWLHVYLTGWPLAARGCRNN